MKFILSKIFQATIIAALCPSLLLAGKGPGEVDIPEVTPLTSKQLASFRSLVKNDSEAAALVAAETTAAAQWRSVIPRPLAVIHYEGLVNTDPKRLATVEKLKDMAKLASLYRDWQATANESSATAMKRIILAWTERYRIDGNNVNENKFYPLLCAYYSLRDTFEGAEKVAVDAWIRELGATHAEALKKSDHLTNRYTKHVRIAALCGLILGKQEWIDEAFNGIRRFVSGSLRVDGTSKDLEHRDSLTYHCSALRPPLELAMLLDADGKSLYSWESASGGSLKKSVDYVVPYAKGEKIHKEWVNTKVKLDRDRAKAGLEKYRAGRHFEPVQALTLMERAAFFDPGLLKIVRDLSPGDAKRFPTWQSLMNAAAGLAESAPSAQ